MEQALVKIWDTIDAKMLDPYFQALPKRIAAVIAEKGGYIEHLKLK